MEWLAEALVNHPEIAIFLSLGVGFWVGKFEVKGIALGTVTGTLLVGVVIGAIVSVPGTDGGAAQVIDVADVTKQVFFLLFLFALGYRVGPQFFAGLKSNGPQVVFTLVLIVVGVVATIVLATLLDYNPGLAAGLSAGALTQSSIIGVAQDAIAGLNQDAETIKQWSDLVSVGYAVTYIFGTIGAAVYCASIAPRLLGISDLPAAAKAEEQELGFAEAPPDTASAFERVERRAYVVPEAAAGRTIAELESELEAVAGSRVHVDRTRHGGVVTAGETVTVAAGDTLALAAVDVAAFADVEQAGWREVGDARLLDFPVEEVDVVVTSDQVAGHALGELGQRTEARGLFVTGLTRAGHDVPLLPNSDLAQGDVVRIQGPRPLVEAVVDEVGYPERSTAETDIVTVGLGIVVGALIGLPTLVVGNVPLSLTSSVGAMLLGLVIGWRRSKSPTFGRIPSGAQWFFESVGLAAFVGIVGLDSGPGFVDGLSQYGLGLFGAGVVVTLVPLVVMTYLARYVFKFDPVQTLGMLTGAQTTTAAIGAVRESAKSSVPLLGFTVPYAVGNIFLSIAGAIVVAVMA